MSLLKSRKIVKFQQPAGFGIMASLFDLEAKKNEMAEKLKDAMKSPSDDIPPKVGSSFRNDSRKNWLARSKEEGEEMKAKQEEEEAAKKAEEEAIKAENEREALSQGANIADAERGGKARRAAKRDAKNAAKEEKAAMKAQCAGLKGSAKRQCNKAAKQNFRGDKKNIRKANRAKKKENFGKTKVGKFLGVGKCTKRKKRKGKC